MDEAEVADVQMAEAVPVFPPRPDAIVTLLTSDDFLPGAQTLLYSVKKSVPSKTMRYPPELVVLVTPNVSETTRKALWPAFCTRIVEVQPLDFPEASSSQVAAVSSHVPSWKEQGGLTKLHVFNQVVYDTILYLDADCLVVKDVSHLLELGKVYIESEALVAAAPDIFPPDKFNAGVMVIRPSQEVFDDMMAQAHMLATYDGGDTGFLNAYFSEWYKEMPPMARLGFGYNAQRFMYHCTYEKQPNYWDMAVAPDLHVIHFSSLPKPWENTPIVDTNQDGNDDNSSTNVQKQQQQFLGEGDVQMLQKTAKMAELDALWRKQYQRSRNFAVKFHRENDIQKNRPVASAPRQRQQERVPTNPKEIHKLVAKRYKELRRDGMDTKEAMTMARSQYGLGNTTELPVGQQIAAMFGMPM